MLSLYVIGQFNQSVIGRLDSYVSCYAIFA